MSRVLSLALEGRRAARKGQYQVLASFRKRSFIVRAIRLTAAVCRPSAAAIPAALTPRLANLFNRCTSSSVHSFGRETRLMVYPHRAYINQSEVIDSEEKAGRALPGTGCRNRCISGGRRARGLGVRRRTALCNSGSGNEMSMARHPGSLSHYAASRADSDGNKMLPGPPTPCRGLIPFCEPMVARNPKLGQRGYDMDCRAWPQSVPAHYLLCEQGPGLSSKDRGFFMRSW
jgi:hypothetical protein